MGRQKGPEAMEVARHFGPNLAERRRQVGLSQDATAERAGLHRTEVALIEGESACRASTRSSSSPGRSK